MAICGLVIAQFAVPNKHERAGAVGSLGGMNAKLVRSFSNEGDFSQKKEPRPGDWLAQHKEKGQTFAQN